MSRPGRPRKNGERFACGQIKPEQTITATQWKRLVSISTDPLLSSAVGRATFLQILDHTQSETAFEIGRIVARADRAMGCRRFCRSSIFERASLGRTDLSEGEDEAARSRSAVNRLAFLESEIRVLAREFFPDLQRTLYAFVLEDENPMPPMMTLLQQALTRLAPILGIRTRAGQQSDNRAGHSRN
jgi:hypothetical protein